MASTSDYQAALAELNALKAENARLRAMIYGQCAKCESIEAESARLRAAGDQMYRAIVYTSGVSLNFAADEWKKVAGEPAK
jgi:hypothetical protein